MASHLFKSLRHSARLLVQLKIVQQSALHGRAPPIYNFCTCCMAPTLIQIQSDLFIVSQPKVSFQFVFLRRVTTWYLLLHTFFFLLQSHILRLQMGSTTFNFEMYLLVQGKLGITRSSGP